MESFVYVERPWGLSGSSRSGSPGHVGNPPAEPPGFPGVVAVAIHEGLDAPAREMRVVEAHGYAKSPPRRDRYCLRPRSMRDLDSRSVSAIRKVVDEQRPEWVAAVKEATRVSDDPRVIAAWISPEIRVEAVVAILLNLKENGEFFD